MKFLPLSLIIAALFLLGMGGQTQSTVVCSGPFDQDVLEATVLGDVGFLMRNGCTGRIGELRITTDRDGVKVQNGSNPAHDFVVESGFIHCIQAGAGVHQDGIQTLAGTRITFRNLTITGCRTSQVMFKKGGRGGSRPTDVVCENCFFGPGAAHTAIIGTSLRTGLKNSTACQDRTTSNGNIEISGTAQQPVNVGNVQLNNC